MIICYNCYMSENSNPYKTFGERIKFLREQWQQSLKEVAVTLEIDELTLKSIEDGMELPDIDQLDMLISHFLLTEDQAEDLRELANISNSSSTKSINSLFPPGLEDAITKQIMMVLPADNKVAYTDSMNATVTDNGVILQFMQSNPGSQQPTTISKLGMSREHANKIIEVLTQTMKQHDSNRKKES